MRKGQKPSKHVRCVRTKKGRKAVVVNRKIKKRRVVPEKLKIRYEVVFLSKRILNSIRPVGMSKKEAAMYYVSHPNLFDEDAESITVKQQGDIVLVTNNYMKNFGASPLRHIPYSPGERKYVKLDKAAVSSIHLDPYRFSERMRKEGERGERMVFEHQAKQKVFGAAQKAFGKSQVVFREKTKKEY